jgi:cytochrome c oxidase cbb3-type subunit III
MRINRGVIPAACAGLILVMTHVAAQGPPQTPPQPGAPQGQTPAGGRGQGRGAGRAVFPAQQRPPDDPAVVERGKAIYSATCSACHGVDARGGQLGGPNLLRSQLVLNDQAGELILPIIRGSRAERGMPPLPMSDEDAKAAAVFLHSLQAAGRPQGAPPDSGTPPPNALVGDASAGEAYFKAKCSSCHSPTGDLSGIGIRLPEAKMLQVAWVTGSSGSGRGGGRGGSGNGRPITATVTMPSGEKIEGRLVSIDHFLVTLMMADDTVRSIRRDGDRPKVEIHDPLAAHKAMLSGLTDKDMHDVTAFLATLK